MRAKGSSQSKIIQNELEMNERHDIVSGRRARARCVAALVIFKNKNAQQSMETNH